jgi:hypothetical protein
MLDQARLKVCGVAKDVRAVHAREEAKHGAFVIDAVLEAHHGCLRLCEMT